MNFIRRETFDMWDGLNNLFRAKILNFKKLTNGKIGKSYMKHKIYRKRLSDKHFEIALDQYKKWLKIIFNSWGRGCLCTCK